MSKSHKKVKAINIQTEEAFLKELGEVRLENQRIGISIWLWAEVFNQFRKKEYSDIRGHFLCWVNNMEAVTPVEGYSYYDNFSRFFDPSIPLDRDTWERDKFIGPFIIKYLIVHLEQDGCSGLMFPFFRSP